MPSRQEVSYFGAGPAPLPTSVVEAGAKAFVNFNDSGLGLGEISHRSPTANKILEDTKANLTTLLDIPENYEILFMQAGGSGEFSAVVQNLVSAWVERRRRRAEAEILQANPNEDKARVEELVFQRVQKEVDEELKLDYLVTGSWSQKASQEAQRLVGSKYVNVALDARKANEGKFGRIPGEESWSLTPTKREGGKGSAFVYFCDNETVDGVEFQDFPKSLEPQGGDEEDERIVVADMSSNFISRKVDVSKYSVIFVSLPPIQGKRSGTNTAAGRCPKEHRRDRYHHRHHPEIPPPSPDSCPPCDTSPPLEHRRPPRPRGIRLRHHREKQLSLQHPSHLQPVDCWPGHGRSGQCPWCKEGQRPGGDRQPQGRSYLRRLGQILASVPRCAGQEHPQQNEHLLPCAWRRRGEREGVSGRG